MNELSLQEVLKENHERYVERKKEQEERIKKENRKNFIIVSVASVLILFLTFDKLGSMTEKEVNNCMAKGYSRTTCIAHL